MIDPVTSLVIVAYIFWGTWGLLRQSVAMSLSAVPTHIDLAGVEAELLASPGVARVHDLHVWHMSTTEIALTPHLLEPLDVLRLHDRHHPFLGLAHQDLFGSQGGIPQRHEIEKQFNGSSRRPRRVQPVGFELPREIFEAAEVDGASSWVRFWKITLPMMTPVLFFTLVTGFIAALQVFTQAFIMTSGGPNNATLFYLLYIYRNAFEYFRMGYASALAWVLFVYILVLTLIVQRSSRYWVFYEGDDNKG